MPNLWEDLSATHGLSEHWNRFVRLKNKFSSKHCGACGDTGAKCCHTDQMLRRLPQEMRPDIASERSDVRVHKCPMIVDSRCVVENFKPPVCIDYFCGRLDKTFRDKNTNFVRKFKRTLLQLASLYYDGSERNNWDGGWSILLQAYFERYPEEHSYFLKHVKDTLGTRIRYPPTDTTLKGYTVTSVETPLWNVISNT